MVGKLTADCAEGGTPHADVLCELRRRRNVLLAALAGAGMPSRWLRGQRDLQIIPRNKRIPNWGYRTNPHLKTRTTLHRRRQHGGGPKAVRETPIISSAHACSVVW